jgi:predicted  nucleic acid-binding Zn-ribbon protein
LYEEEREESDSYRFDLDKFKEENEILKAKVLNLKIELLGSKQNISELELQLKSEKRAHHLDSNISIYWIPLIFIIVLNVIFVEFSLKV